MEYFYISDPELSVCLSVHTFYVRYQGRWHGSAADTDGDRFSESRVERVAGLGTRLPLPRVTFPHYTRGCYNYLHCARNAAGDVDSRT